MTGFLLIFGLKLYWIVFGAFFGLLWEMVVELSLEIDLRRYKLLFGDFFTFDLYLDGRGLAGARCRL